VGCCCWLQSYHVTSPQHPFHEATFAFYMHALILLDGPARQLLVTRQILARQQNGLLAGSLINSLSCSNYVGNCAYAEALHQTVGSITPGSPHTLASRLSAGKQLMPGDQVLALLIV